MKPQLFRKVYSIISVLIFITIMLPATIPANVTGNINLTSSLYGAREDILSYSFLPEKVALSQEFTGEGLIRYAWYSQDFSRSCILELSGQGSISCSNDWSLDPKLNSALCLLSPFPELEVSIGYGTNERGIGLERALYDVIGYSSPYTGLALTWIPDSNVSLFLATDLTGIIDSSSTPSVAAPGFEAGFNWTPSTIQISGAFSILQSGLITGGFLLSADILYGIWILEAAFETRNPSLYPSNTEISSTPGLILKDSECFPMYRIAAQYSLFDTSSWVFANSITYRASAYTPAELSTILQLNELERLLADNTLAGTGRLSIMQSIEWTGSSGLSAALTGYLNPLDASGLVSVSLIMPMNFGDISCTITGAGGNDPADEYRLIPTACIATISYQLYL